MNGPVTLAYARASRRRAERKWIRVTVITAVILIFLWISHALYPWCRARIQILQWESQCQRFSAPPGTVVYGENEVADTMTQLPEYDSIRSGSAYTNTSHIFQFKSRALEAVEQLGYHTGEPIRYGHADLYAGERTTKKGTVRIVAVMLEWAPWHCASNVASPLTVDAVVVEREPWFGKSKVDHATFLPIQLGNWPMFSVDGKQTEFLAGQPDPGDPSHFMISYSIGGKPGIIDGVLNSDLSVSITPRTGPLAVP